MGQAIEPDWSLLRQPACSPYDEPKGFCQDIIGLQPTSLLEQVRELVDPQGWDGVLHLRGLPIDSDLPPTPVDGAQPQKRTYLSESVMALLVASLGEQIGYRQEKGGALFHQITPARSEAHEQSSEGSEVALDLHTERCFHPYLPDYLLLYCLRRDPGGAGATSYVLVEELLRELDDEAVDLLYQPRFRTGIDYSFGNRATEKANGPVLPVLSGPRDRPRMRYDRDLMVGLDDPAQAALDRLGKAIPGLLRELVLKPGEALLLDNLRSIHGRGVFHPGYRGDDRWLQRVYAVRDLVPSTLDRPGGGRVIATRFD